MPSPLNDTALDQLFRSARSYGRFLPRAVERETINALYELLKWGPTAFNAQPARYVILQSDEAKALFDADSARLESTGQRNTALQGAYLILAARALGLDAGPMSGFDPGAVNREFFADGRNRADFLINLGYGDPESLRPRGPRLGFAQAVTVL